MTADEVRNLIAAEVDASEIQVQGEGNSFQVVVVSHQFAGMSPVKKQQLVYAGLNPHLASGAIHAVTMKTFTPEEWAQAGQA